MRKRIPILLLLFSMLLGIHDGYLALWEGEDPEPVVIYPCPAALLPPEDQSALHAGIVIEDRTQLHQRLEDYWS